MATEKKKLDVDEISLGKDTNDTTLSLNLSRQFEVSNANIRALLQLQA